MASLWNKTLFYLGLVDEEEQQADPGMEPMGAEVQPLAPQGAAPPPASSGVSAVRPPGSGVSGRRVEPPPSTRRQMSSDRGHAEAGVYVHSNISEFPTDAPVRRTDPESQIIAARNFADAQSLADAIRSGRSVVLDLRGTEPEMVRRLVDFASGLTYALDGKMSKTAQGVILVTPTGVSIGMAEQERLSQLGLYGPSN